jgi:hypothetical protein
MSCLVFLVHLVVKKDVFFVPFVIFVVHHV